MELLNKYPLVKGILFDIISLFAIVAYFLPLLIVLFKRLWHHRSFVLFALYWLVAGVVNVLVLIPELNPEFLRTLKAGYNMLDIPFILTIFYFTTSSDRIRHFVKFVLIGFIIIELINAYIKGINYQAIKYVLGLGVFLVLTIVVWEIVWYLRKMVHSAKEKAMIFIYSALLFEYGTYIIIYIFDYFITGSDNTDNLLIYYLSSFIAIVIACCGFLIRQNRYKVSGMRYR